MKPCKEGEGGGGLSLASSSGISGCWGGRNSPENERKGESGRKLDLLSPPRFSYTQYPYVQKYISVWIYGGNNWRELRFYNLENCIFWKQSWAPTMEKVSDSRHRQTRTKTPENRHPANRNQQQSPTATTDYQQSALDDRHPTAEAEFMNVQFRSGSWEKSWEFPDLRFLYGFLKQ